MAAQGGNRILMICTSTDKLESGEPTGLWAGELAVPYILFKNEGCQVDVASVKGGRIPVDPASMDKKSMPPEVEKFLGDASVKKMMESSSPIRDAKHTYDAIFIPGGHGALLDLPNEKECHNMIEKHCKEGKIIAAVGHGLAALLGVKAHDGNSMVKGKKMTAFSNSEEEELGLTQKLPFLLEDKLKEQGANYKKGPNFQPFTVSDGQLITGQNQNSSAMVARMVMNACKAASA